MGTGTGIITPMDRIGTVVTTVPDIMGLRSLSERHTIGADLGYWAAQDIPAGIIDVARTIIMGIITTVDGTGDSERVLRGLRI